MARRPLTPSAHIRIPVSLSVGCAARHPPGPATAHPSFLFRKRLSLLILPRVDVARVVNRSPSPSIAVPTVSSKRPAVSLWIRSTIGFMFEVDAGRSASRAVAGDPGHGIRNPDAVLFREQDASRQPCWRGMTACSSCGVSDRLDSREEPSRRQCPSSRRGSWEKDTGCSRSHTF